MCSSCAETREKGLCCIGAVVILDTLDFLLGTWRIARVIEDHRSRTCGSFDGMATLTTKTTHRDAARGMRARYEEAGEMRLDGYVGHAHRLLEYRREAADDPRLMLYFADGRPFVDLDLRSGAWQSDHPCGDDRYEIATFVRSDDLVQERWRVRGPTKDYDATTTLLRVLG